MAKPQPVIPIERIARRIYLIRGQKVMLDSDLAELYGVPTSRLNEQVKRNRERFPEDFAFQLSREEAVILMSQIATSSNRHGGRRKLPWAFTEHGVAMLSSVLRSKKAIQVNIGIVRTFVEVRQFMASNKDLARKVEEHDRKITLLIESVQKILAATKPAEEKPDRLRPAEGLALFLRKAQCRLRSVARPKLTQDISDVPLDRHHLNAKRPRDFLVRRAMRQVSCHFVFPRRKCPSHLAAPSFTRP